METIAGWLSEGSVRGAIATAVLGLITVIVKPKLTAWQRARTDRKNATDEAIGRIEIWMTVLDDKIRAQGSAINDQRARLHSHLQNEEAQAIVESATHKERQLIHDADIARLSLGLDKVHSRVDDLYNLIASRFGGMT